MFRIEKNGGKIKAVDKCVNTTRIEIRNILCPIPLYVFARRLNKDGDVMRITERGQSEYGIG